MNSNGFFLTEEMLWDYADGLLTPEERVKVEAYLQQYPAQQQLLRQVEASREALMSVAMDSPRAGFAHNVMAAWVSEQVQERQVPADKKLLLFPVLLGGSLVAALAGAVWVVIAQGIPTSVERTKPLLPYEMPELPIGTLQAILQSSMIQWGVFAVFTGAVLMLMDYFLRKKLVPQQA